MSAAPGPVRCRRRAFTLVELVATIVVLGVVGGVVSRIVFAVSDGFLAASTSAQLHAELSMATDRVVRELRRIALDPEVTDAAPDVDRVTATSIAWEGDSSLVLSGSNLELAVDGGEPAVLLRDVIAFEVRAYDESNAALAASLSGTECDPIRRLRLTTTIRRHGESETLRTKVFLRCAIDGAGP